MLTFNPSHLFRETVEIQDGPRIEVAFSTAGERDQPNFEFSAPKILIRVRPTSMASNGMVIRRLSTDTRFLLTSHTSTPSYRVHRAFECDAHLKWEKSVQVLDPLTNEPRSEERQDQGNIWVLRDMIRRSAPDFIMRISDSSNLIVTGEPVEVGDFIGGELVKRVDAALGVNIVQVQ